MRHVYPLVLIATVSLFTIASLTTAETPGRPEKLRIGVYDSRAIVVGSRDNKWFTGVEELMKQKKEAQAAGDKNRVAEIERRGQAIQQVRHMQGFSNAPVDDIIEHIKDKLPEIATKAGVDVIVARPDYLAEGVETVDVTDQLVAALNPSDKTLKTVAELRKHTPISLIDALMIED